MPSQLLFLPAGRLKLKLLVFSNFTLVDIKTQVLVMALWMELDSGTMRGATAPRLQGHKVIVLVVFRVQNIFNDEKEIEQEGLTLRKLSVGTGINASITYNF